MNRGPEVGTKQQRSSSGTRYVYLQNTTRKLLFLLLIRKLRIEQ
jgi:hypothetical protein